MQSFRKSLQEARASYSEAIATRASSQREVNQLLQRKNTWSPEDLERFTGLYRSDHANEQAESSARENLSRVEDESEEAAAKLTASILARYHEEQIWSDKIRRVSTWGTLALMGVNVLLFLIFQVGVEPWRRKRLVKGFEQKVQDALREAAESQSLLSRTDVFAPRGMPAVSKDETSPAGIISAEAVDTAEVVTPEVPAVEVTEDLSVPRYAVSSPLTKLGESVKDTWSERTIELRRRDLTAAIIEGAAAGAAVVGLVVFFLRPR